MTEHDSAGTGWLLQVAAVRRSQFLKEALRPHGVRPRWYGVLVTLAESGPLPQQQLGETLGIDRTTMVGLIDQLEEEALLQRRRSPDDRRRYLIGLTAEGERHAKGMLVVGSEADAELLAGLTPHEIRTLDELLARIADQPAAPQPAEPDSATPQPTAPPLATLGGAAEPRRAAK
ncbi:MarR family transcriptional regulator [Streptomyces sp. LHD-70]|uniref:MarR family winged helix-turn-helix transcriptional regulator n=1 Tax=Streptomyces sp. LHD-70 TaxID=3072140 RepID=UPI002810570E|nr:MarR family transcriptional regulator [Streptomyces sp. LHD-70]MDQ8705986.1 MarR family transcriptional regulator [Streptomyces sp. LHD-70]